MVERVAASGSCIRCQRSLGLASVKHGDLWYGSTACAEGRACPFDSREPEVSFAIWGERGVIDILAYHLSLIHI